MSHSEVKLGFIEIPQAQPQPLNICRSGLWGSGKFVALTSQLRWNFSCKNKGSEFVAVFIFWRGQRSWNLYVKSPMCLSVLLFIWKSPMTVLKRCYNSSLVSCGFWLLTWSDLLSMITRAHSELASSSQNLPHKWGWTGTADTTLLAAGCIFAGDGFSAAVSKL